MPAPRATRVPAINMISGIVRLLAVIATPLLYLQIQMQNGRCGRGKDPWTGYGSYVAGRLRLNFECSFNHTLTNEPAPGSRLSVVPFRCATTSDVVESPISVRVARRPRFNCIVSSGCRPETEVSRSRCFPGSALPLLSSGLANWLPSQTLCHSFRVLTVVWTVEMNHSELKCSDLRTMLRHSLRPIKNQPCVPIVYKDLPTFLVRFDGQAQMLIVEPPSAFAPHRDYGSNFMPLAAVQHHVAGTKAGTSFSIGTIAADSRTISAPSLIGSTAMNRPLPASVSVHLPVNTTWFCVSVRTAS
jgi:hypothetical protein